MGRLLPTPRTSDQNGTGQHGAGGMDLRTAVKMLPTPHGFPKDGQHRKPGPTGNELGRTLTLLPTPRTVDGQRPRMQESREGWGATLGQALQSSGATTSPPSDAGKPSTGLRLNPSFVGWMMGTPSCGECGREWTDPDCPHSATAFTSTSADSSGRP